MGDSMSTIINATTTNGVVIQPDNSGSLVLQTNSGTTALTIDTSQRAAFVAGTAALPAITTTGDTNTGMFFPAADTIAFAEGGAEAMRLDSSGNVTVGTTATTYNYQTKNIALYDGASSGISVASGTKILTLTSQASGGCFVGTRSNDDLKFTTNDTERMRIDSSGRVLVNATGIIGSDTAPFQVTGGSVTAITVKGGSNNYFQAFYNTSNSLIGSITGSTGSSTAYNTSSDYRLKENIAPMTGALAIVQALKPVTYKWKVDGSDGQGFIAHELAEVVPDCVSGEKDAVEVYTDEDGIEQTKPKYQGIDTSFLVATLTAAIQEQQTIINDLKARVETLEAK
jgi:hypothetical protein